MLKKLLATAKTFLVGVVTGVIGLFVGYELLTHRKRKTRSQSTEKKLERRKEAPHVAD